MFSERIQDALNKQINEEQCSSHLYLSAAAHCERVQLKGFSKWFRHHAHEKSGRAKKIFNYVLQRGGRVELESVEPPTAAWDSPWAVFNTTLQHERHITGCIQELVDLSLSESDHATNNFLRPLVSKQVEEEVSMDRIVQRLEQMGDAPVGLFMLDRSLA